MNTYMIRQKCALALALCSIAAASAQSSASDTDNYSRVTLGTVISQPVYTGDGIARVSNHNLYGVSAGYLVGINVAGHSMPLFVEVGPELGFARRSEEIDYWEDHTLTLHDEIQTKRLTLSSPVNMVYLHHFTDAIALAPSAGLQAKVNLLAETSSEGKTTSLFDAGANRFQLGWDVGCGIYFGRFHLGFSYVADITPFMSDDDEKERYQNLNFSIGLKF